MSETEVKQEVKTKKCKHCQSDIPVKAKVCPVCKKKQSSKLKVFLIIFAVLVVLGVIGSINGDDTTTTTDTSSTTQNSQNAVPAQTEEVIEYTAITVDQLDQDLKDNSLKASETYKGQYLEITGRLSNIDASGKYINLSNDDYLDVYGVQCYVKDDNQKQKIMDMKKDEHYTIRVKIKDVGEVMGYSADIIEFVD